MSLKQKLTLSTVLVVLGLFTAFLGYLAFPFALAGSAVGWLGIFLRFRWNRCPYCKSWLGRNGIPRYCPGCGKKIDPEEKTP